MIDLRIKGLPNHIEVAGKSFLLDTDFREWIEFGERLNDEPTLLDLLFVVKDINGLDVMLYGDEILDKLMEFYINKNETPVEDTTSGEVVVDYVLDGEYIYSSFMQAYSIDLTEVDMHWHKFKALFLGLPDDTKIKQIISMRSWEKTRDSYETTCKKLKEMWQLPNKEDEEEAQRLLDEFNKL